MYDDFSNHWGKEGFSYEEAMAKKAKVDEVHLGPNSRWKPAKIVPDKRGGYKVIVETK